MVSQDTPIIEIRLHGRGGQGAVIASTILATAAFLDGQYVQSFPAFGVERRGAPVAAYVRLSREPILLRCAIYEPHHIVVLEKNLMQSVSVAQGLRKDGWVVVNTPPEHEAAPPMIGTTYPSYAMVDASGIAARNKLGTRTTPIVNTAMVGAFARVTGLITLDSVLDAIRRLVPIHVERNLAAAQEAYKETVLYPQNGTPRAKASV